MKAILKGSPKLLAILVAVVVAVVLAGYGCAAATEEEPVGEAAQSVSQAQANASSQNNSQKPSGDLPTVGSVAGANQSSPSASESSQGGATDESSAQSGEGGSQGSASQPSGESSAQQTTSGQSGQNEAAPQDVYVDPVPVQAQESNIAEESQALQASTPAMPIDYDVSAPGIAVEANDKASVDYSNAASGYVMVNYTAPTDRRIKVIVDGPTTRYQYNINPGEWVALPLSDGNGGYSIGVYENVQGSSYAEVLTAHIDAQLQDEYAPFRRSNQYVNILAAPQTVAKAQEICGSEPAALKKVQLVYDFVVNNLTYDQAKAASVQSGYLPNLDQVLNARTGICFDYAALMTGMLRSQGVPCKLVVGYAGDVYHAWIDVWTQDGGWVSGAIYFDGNAWQRMDPTFASSGGQSEDVMRYIGDGQNYASKYFY